MTDLDAVALLPSDVSGAGWEGCGLPYGIGSGCKRVVSKHGRSAQNFGGFSDMLRLNAPKFE